LLLNFVSFYDIFEHYFEIVLQLGFRHFEHYFEIVLQLGFRQIDAA